MAKTINIGSQDKIGSRERLSKMEEPWSEAIDDFNLEIGFIEAVIDVLFTIDGHNMLDELHNGTVCSLLAPARDSLERTKEYTNSLWHSLKEAKQVKAA